MDAAPTLLDLKALPSQAELHRSVAEALALAATVVLERLHGPRETDPATLQGHGDDVSLATIVRVALDDTARRSYADPPEAVEQGAVAIAILAARPLFSRIVFRRLPKGSGADYLMRDPLSKEDDQYERLECSGIGSGRESAAARLRGKLEQLARYPDWPSGRAVVTDFRPCPVQIHHGSWE